MSIVLKASIKGITYKPFLCKDLPKVSQRELEEALNAHSCFICDHDSEYSVAISCWVSPKRTRSYPYERVYNTLGFPGRTVTVIPVIKDEGLRGDRDYLQWDTVTLLSLLGVYVILVYYKDATVNPRDPMKISNQIFDYQLVDCNLQSLKYYRSSALHWNLEQLDKMGALMQNAIDAYAGIGKKLDIKMHSPKGIEKRIAELAKSKEDFLEQSRLRSEQAQIREVASVQPKEKHLGQKVSITISNHVGGLYQLTADDHKIVGQNIYLIESKHSASKPIPAISDIKDGLLKISLFCNLKEVVLNNKILKPIPKLRLTSSKSSDFSSISTVDQKNCHNLLKEANANQFDVELPFSMI